MGRRISPTQTAIFLRQRIEPLARELAEALDAAECNRNSEDAGNIRFGAMPGFLQTQVVPLLAEFQQENPDVSFDVTGDDDPNSFMRGSTDLMLYYGPVNNPHLIEHWVSRSVFVPCASPKYLESRGVPHSPADLASHAGVVYTGRVRPHSTALELADRRESFCWKSEIRFNNILLAKTATIEGCGIVLDMPLHHCYREILSGLLVPVLDGWHVRNLDNYIASTREAGRLRRVQRFIEWYVRRRREIEGEQRRQVQMRHPMVADY